MTRRLNARARRWSIHRANGLKRVNASMNTRQNPVITYPTIKLPLPSFQEPWSLVRLYPGTLSILWGDSLHPLSFSWERRSGLIRFAWNPHVIQLDAQIHRRLESLIWWRLTVDGHERGKESISHVSRCLGIYLTEANCDLIWKTFFHPFCTPSLRQISRFFITRINFTFCTVLKKIVNCWRACQSLLARKGQEPLTYKLID